MWFNKAEAVPTMVPKPGPPRPKGEEIVVDPNAAEEKEYLRVASKLGLVTPSLSRLELLRKLKDAGFQMFDFETVVKHLDARYGETSETDIRWSWRPLTGADTIRTGFASIKHSNGGDDKPKRMWLPNCYDKPIPLSILLHIEKIREFAPEAGIFISDERLPSEVKDPFLALSLPGLREFIVVLCWDEPGFGFQKHSS